MLHKLRQFVKRHRKTASNRLPLLRSRQYLLNNLRRVRVGTPTAEIRAAMGLLRWAMMKTYYRESRIAYHATCLLTGRTRGVSQRYSVSRTRIRHLSGEGKLFGARKSSW